METSYQLLSLGGGEKPGVGLAAIVDSVKQRQRTANLRLSDSPVTALTNPPPISIHVTANQNILNKFLHMWNDF